MKVDEKPVFSTAKRAAWFVAFSLLALLGNYASLPIGFNVDFIFGSVFALLAIVLLGPSLGVLVALIGASYTYLLWNHPYAIPIFTCEALFVALVSRKKPGRPIFLIDFLFWLLLGVPLVYLFYAGVMHLDGTVAGIISLKQSLNGITNAILASVILNYAPLWRWLGHHTRQMRRSSYAYFESMAFLLLLVCFGSLFYMNKKVVDDEVASLSTRVSKSGYEASWMISDWLGNHLRAAEKLAEMGEKEGFVGTQKLQRSVETVHGLYPDFHNMFVGDADSTTLAFDPPVNERGESTIGINFADRAWFKTLKETGKPVISDVFVGRGGIFEPIVSISSPIVRDDKLIGFGLGAVNLGHLKTLVTELAARSGFSFTLLDQKGKVVIASHAERKPLEDFAFEEDSVTREVTSGVYLNQPRAKKNAAAIQTWKDSRLYSRSPVSLGNWTVLTEASLAPLQQVVYRRSILNLISIYILMIVASGISFLVSRHLSRPMIRLTEISRGVPEKIEAGALIDWPESNSLELSALIENFDLTAENLRERILALRRSNEALEEAVSRRTAALEKKVVENQHLIEQEKNRIRQIEQQKKVLEREVIERKRTEAVLRESEERYRILVETLPHGVSVVDVGHRIVMVNRALAGMYRQPPEWFVGRHCYEVFGKCEAVCDHCPGGASVREDELSHVETVGVRADGTRINLMLYTAPFEFSDGSRGFIEVVEDITQRKQVESRTQQMARMASLGEMASGVGHEINNPINGILNCADLLKSRLQDEASHVKLLDMILRESQRIAKIVRTLLMIAHPGQRGNEDFDLKDALEAVLALSEKKLLKDGIALSIDAPEEPLVVCGEIQQLEQLFLNLINNASYALNKRFPGAHDEKILSIRLNCDEQDGLQKIMVEVKDFGCGMSEESLSRAFDPFFTTKPAGEGTGLGLGLCFEIVKQHGGTISIDSRENQFTSVTVTLPRG